MKIPIQLGNPWFVLLVLAIVAPTSASGQVVARQGEVPEAEKKVEFTSPMVLELPVELSALEEGEGLLLKGFEKYVCEDTRLTRLTVTQSRASGKKGDVYLVDGTVAVGSSHDRFVSVQIDFFAGSQRLATASRMNLDVEEGKQRMFQLRLEVPPELVPLIRSGGREGTVAKITIQVADND